MIPAKITVLTMLALASCGSPPPPASSAVDTTAGEPPVSARMARPDAVAALGEVGPPRVGVACRLAVSDPVGCDAAQIEALVAPVRSRLEGCRGAAGGKVRIVVRKASGKLVFDLQPGSSLDPTSQQCVLAALGSIPEATAANLGAGASVPPSGFTSLLTIDW